jgi:Transposase DDE domain
MILPHALPKIKTFLRPALLSLSTSRLVIALVAAFMHHPGRMSASQAAGSIRSEARHRAQLVRFLARSHWSKNWQLLRTVADLLWELETQRGGTWVFILDQTYIGQVGQKTENTFSCGNTRPRAKKSNRKQKKYAKRSCHGFVCGLLITPSGFRIPCCRSYYTQDYCQKRQYTYRKQTELAAELIDQVSIPAGARVIVLGDTAFEAACIQTVCQKRDFLWIVPINPERVLAGTKPRPKIRSLVETFSAQDFEAVGLLPGQGETARYQRAATCRWGPKTKERTYWVHTERRPVHNVGQVVLVFSTKEQPRMGQKIVVQKVLMTNGLMLTAAEIVRWYSVRWQIEQFFKELKSGLGLNQYRFRGFRKVENWVQACLVTFVYLEWYRALQLQRADLPDQQKRWWQWQRCYGVARAVLSRAEETDLAWLLRRAATKSGLRKLRAVLRAALPLEYRNAA